MGRKQLLLDVGNELELVEIPAPIEAFEGLQDLNNIVAQQSEIEESDSIAMLPVNSSMANTVGYDEDNHILQVEFQNGRIYQYSGVEEDTWEDFCQADSMGRFYNQEIKGKYDSQKF
jgi:KTSC domain